jgi:hypothetical protein
MRNEIYFMPPSNVLKLTKKTKVAIVSHNFCFAKILLEMIPDLKITSIGFASSPYRDMHDVLRIMKLFQGRLFHEWGGLFPVGEMMKPLMKVYDYVILDLGSNFDCSETVEDLIKLDRGKTVLGIVCDHPRNARANAAMRSLAKSSRFCNVQTSWYGPILTHHPQTLQDIARLMGNHLVWGEGSGASFDKALSVELELRMKVLNEAFWFFLKKETGGAPNGNMLIGFLGIVVVIASAFTGSFVIR